MRYIQLTSFSDDPIPVSIEEIIDIKRERLGEVNTRVQLSSGINLYVKETYGTILQMIGKSDEEKN